MSGLIWFLELPNFLFTIYKKVFNLKKSSYQVRPIENFINFAPETHGCWYVDKKDQIMVLEWFMSDWRVDNGGYNFW